MYLMLWSLRRTPDVEMESMVERGHEGDNATGMGLEVRSNKC